MSHRDRPRHALDELRRFVGGLGAGAGLAPARAAALASHLLWFDTAGAPALGLATLPDLLERIDAGAIRPQAEGKVGPERAGTAVLDGQHGVPALILARAADLAGEKARDVGVGLVRVTGLGPAGPATFAAAERAVGPDLALVLGPGGAWSLALPTGGGLPVVFDPALAGSAESPPPPPHPALAGLIAPWEALAPDGGWLVVVANVTALEPLTTYQERLAALLAAAPPAPGRLLPAAWEATRREARRRGLAPDPAALRRLRERAGRLGLPMPAPVP